MELALILFWPLILQAVLALVILYIFTAIFVGIDTFFQKYIYPVFNKLIYKHYKQFKCKILGNYNCYFDDFIFFIFFISSLALTYFLFCAKELNGDLIIYRLYIANSLIIFYWIKDVGKERYNNEPSFIHIISFAIISVIYTKVFMFFYFYILREHIEQNVTGAFIFMACKILEGLIYSGTYQFLKKRFRG